MRFLFFLSFISFLHCKAQDTLRLTLIGKWGIDIPADQMQNQLMKVSSLNVEIIDLEDSIKMNQNDSAKVQRFRDDQNYDKLVITEMASHMEKMKQLFLRFNDNGILESNNGNEGTFTVDEKQKLLYVKRKTGDIIDTVQVEDFNRNRIVLHIVNENENLILIQFDDGITPPDEDDERKN